MADAPLDAAGHRARLRQRLFDGGGDALLDHELVEYLLALAIPRRDTKMQAKALLKQFGGIGRLLDKHRDQLQNDLDKARGAVSPEEHLQRVMQVSNAIYNDEDEVRDAARRRVREAINEIVDTVVCKDIGEKVLQMSLAGGRVAFQFNNRGIVLQKSDLGDCAAFETGFKGLGAEEAWGDIKRRRRS